MKNMNHDKWLMIQAEKARKALGKENKSDRLYRIQHQRGSVYANKRTKLKEKAFMCE